MQIINGKNHADKMLSDIKLRVANLAVKNIFPSFAIIMVGDSGASKLYVNNKMSRAKEVGIKAELVYLPSDISQEKLLSTINELNNNNSINGVIVQLPLPDHIDKYVVQQSILPSKDIDGFHPINVGMLSSGIEGGFLPCTPQGCMDLIKTILPDISGKIAVVIGRSNIVGKPLSLLLLQEDATVIIAHSKTKELHLLTNTADIVVSAVGKPLFLNRKHFKKGAVVIDVGINHIVGNSIVGDVDFEDVKDIGLAAITPVPGGVGPMTVAYLLANVVKTVSRFEEN